MAKELFIADLKPKMKGQRISAPEWNALIKNHKGDTSLSVGYADSQSSAIGHKDKSVGRYIWVYTPEAIPPYSVFGVSGVPDSGSSSISIDSFSSPVRAIVSRIGTTYSGSPLALATNGSIELKPGWNQAIPISMWDTFILEFSGSMPPIGHPLGVKPNTYEIEEGRFGFACVGVGPTETTCQVLRVTEPAKVFGRVTEEIGPATPPDLATGRIKVYVRGDAANALAAMDPDTGETPWEMQVFNAREKTYSVGSYVECTNTLGIGLLVDYGKASSSSSSGSSSGSCKTDIDGIEVLDLPHDSADNAMYNIQVRADGCLILTEIGDCEDDDEGGSES